MSEYGDRNILATKELRVAYSKHIDAMTGEGLHSKAEIAAELAWRDVQIESLQQQLAKKEADNASLRAARKELADVIDNQAGLIEELRRKLDQASTDDLIASGGLIEAPAQSFTKELEEVQAVTKELEEDRKLTPEIMNSRYGEAQPMGDKNLEHANTCERFLKGAENASCTCKRGKKPVTCPHCGIPCNCGKNTENRSK